MKESIHIKNLGPLVEVQIDEIKSLTLLIGESASGKSTLLKSLSLFRYLFKLLNIRSYLKLSNISKSPFRIQMESLLKSSGLLDMVSSETMICYTVKGVEQSYTLSYQNRKLSGASMTIRKEDLQFSKVSFVAENRTIIPIWAGKNASVKGGGLGFYFQQTYADFTQATEHVKELSLTHLELKLDVKMVNKIKKYHISPTSKSHHSIELLDASSGIQTSTPLMVIAHYFATQYSFKDAFRRSVLDYLYDSDRLKDFTSNIELGDLSKWVHIHIEEPELSLYPTAQCLLLDALVSTCLNNPAPDRKLSLMIATHSPYLINQLNLLLQRGRVGVRDKAYIKPSDLAVYKIVSGRVQNLLAIDSSTGALVVNTIDLSEPISNIYDEYQRTTQL